MRHKPILLFILLLAFFGYSQNPYAKYAGDFIHPLDIDLKLSGNFGELRSNHFHSGLDIKTNQRVGAKVFAVANGYVSRIKIERYGYGKAIYVTHPNGTTSVYAHLQKFAPRIEAYVKKKQYAKERYEIQLFPDDMDLRVDQGEQIAFSGNSGGSGGPHLHFEIRDSAARPINPILLGIDIPDTKRPVIKKVMVYPMDDTSTINGRREPQLLRLIPQKNGKYKFESFSAYGEIGFGVSMHDSQNGSANKNGVYHLEAYLNGTSIFAFKADRYAFKETRHLNQLIDYGYFKKNKSRIMRLYVPPTSPLSLYKEHLNRGVIQCYTRGQKQAYKVIVKDISGNESVLTGTFDTEDPLTEVMSAQNDHLTFVKANVGLFKTLESFNISIPAGALYEDALLDIHTSNDTINIHQDDVPLHKNMYINYDLQSKQGDLLRQYYLGRVTDWGSVYYVSSSIKKGVLSAKTRTFGKYAISKDIVPPTIKPHNFKDKQWISKHKSLILRIDDKHTDVKNYRATLNGQYILMEYDYKTNKITHDFDDGVVKEGENKLKVVVTDMVGNSSTFSATFFRKTN